MKFSIVIPTYNKANTIEQALDSIYDQTVNNFEIIVVNDGSTDNILDVLDRYDKPVRVISQENKGVSVARNTGIDHAVGEYICFLDADDMWYPNHLEVVSDMMKKYPSAEYFGTCHRSSFPDGRIVDGNSRLSDLDEIMVVHDLIGFINKYGGVVNTNSICVKRSILLDEKIYFEPGEKMGEDVDVWYRIALKHPIVISSKMTTLYRREFSTATAVTSNPPDWCFVKRKESIINDKDISDENKESFINMCDRYYMAIGRELSYNKNIGEALKRIMRVRHKLSVRFIISLTIILLPSFLLRMIPSKYKK